MPGPDSSEPPQAFAFQRNGEATIGVVQEGGC